MLKFCLVVQKVINLWYVYHFYEIIFFLVAECSK